MKEMKFLKWHKAKSEFMKEWKNRRPKCLQCRKSLKPHHDVVRISDSRHPYDLRSDYTKRVKWWGYDNWQNFCSAKCAVRSANFHWGKREVI